MTGGQWEVVGGKSKKAKAKTVAVKSKGKEKNVENATLANSAPIQESATIYSAFLEKEKKYDPPKTNGFEAKSLKPSDKNVQKKRKGDKKPTSPKVTLEDLFASVKEEDIKNHLATLEVLAPNSPLLWLKDLTAFFNVKLDISVEDHTYSTKPPGYPSTLLDKKALKRIKGIFSTCTSQMLQIFHEFCLQNLVQDTLKGLHTLGYQLMLQCLAHESPSVALANIAKCSDLCTSHQNRQNVCLSVLWAAGQVAHHSLEAGFKVWFDLMFPLIGSKNCTAYVVEYLEKLLSSSDASKCEKSLLDVRDLFPILDFIHSKELAKGIQKRLIAVYPRIKALSYGPEPENVLRNYFPSYLRRLESRSPQSLQDEVLSSLAHCLEKDTRCYSIWRQLYARHLAPSRLLIGHLNEQWNRRSSSFPLRCLRDTLSAFRITDDELAAAGKGEAGPACKELLTKLHCSSFSWSRLVLLLVLALGSALVVDAVFAESTVLKAVQSSGVWAVGAQAGNKFVQVYGTVHRFSEQHAPVLAAQFRKAVLPFADLCLERVREAAALLWRCTEAPRAWGDRALPPLLAQVEHLLVVYSTAARGWTEGALAWTGRGVGNVFAATLEGAEQFAVWIESSPEVVQTVEIIKKATISAVESVQQSALYGMNFVKNYISS